MSVRSGWDLISHSDYNWILLGGEAVKRINISFFYELGDYLSQVKAMNKDAPWIDAYVPFIVTEGYLGQLLNSEPVALTYCIEDARNLHRFIDEAVKSRKPDASKKRDKLEPWEISQGKWLIDNFEKSLVTELREINIYFVSPVGIFSTSALLTKAEEMFGEHRNLLPEVAVKQIKEAGKCLAFSLGSAAAFHLFAALESVLRVYYSKLSGGAPAPKNPSMGAYLGELSKLPGVDKKLIAALWQVKDLHRNPAIHFETIIEVGEALTLVGMIQSAISITLDVVAKLPTPAAVLLPKP